MLLNEIVIYLNKQYGADEFIPNCSTTLVI